METKQELKQIINDLENQLKEAQNKLENLDKNERFIPNPKEEELYYFIDSMGCVRTTTAIPASDFDKGAVDFYNCFKTKEEAEKEANKILIRRKLEDLARRLNEDKEINWNNGNQIKYHIMYNFERRDLDYVINYKYKDEGCIYCLNNNFLYEAIKEIGEEQLIDYIKGE